MVNNITYVIVLSFHLLVIFLIAPQNETLGYGVVTRKKYTLWVRWSNYKYSDWVTDTPENGLTIALARDKIRDEKLQQLIIW